jgi:hypothetical protein
MKAIVESFRGLEKLALKEEEVRAPGTGTRTDAARESHESDDLLNTTPSGHLSVPPIL